ncbi:LysR family transcriptional regulator [Pseudohalocynthiibacter aestuariivivens]|nr:LysR family transcriptional regulator [Pseudohalocynthiibacter aestuariivivens]QIE45194.1 LysR family transcriptional regulator [Pseudohalocynthiibacter aestuariivivens]
MHTDHLRSFRTVATSGSFTAAAKLLSKSQSTVSGQVSGLEDHLGVQLFVRTTRSCRLTPEGRELFEYSEVVLEAVDRIYDALSPTLLGGKVKVGVPDDGYLFQLITDGLRSFIGKRPDVNIEIVAGLADDLNVSLASGLLDLAVVRDVHTEGDPICVSQLSWIAKPDFTLPEDGVLPLAHVNKPCCYYKEATNTLSACAISWKSTVSCTSLQGVLAMVQSGLTVAAVLEDENIDSNLFTHKLDLPALPRFGLSFRFASEKPPMLARLIAKAIRKSLDQYVLLDRSIE